MPKSQQIGSRVPGTLPSIKAGCRFEIWTWGEFGPTVISAEAVPRNAGDPAGRWMDPGFGWGDEISGFRETE